MVGGWSQWRIEDNKLLSFVERPTSLGGGFISQYLGEECNFGW
jgi:hypothetical protein